MLARVYAHRSAITLHNFMDQCLKNMQLENHPKKYRAQNTARLEPSKSASPCGSHQMRKPLSLSK